MATLLLISAAVLSPVRALHHHAAIPQNHGSSFQLHVSLGSKEPPHLYCCNKRGRLGGSVSSSASPSPVWLCGQQIHSPQWMQHRQGKICCCSLWHLGSNKNSKYPFTSRNNQNSRELTTLFGRCKWPRRLQSWGSVTSAMSTEVDT